MVPHQNHCLNHDFRSCLGDLMYNGMETHPRNTTTRELLNYNITLKNARNRIITFPERNTNLKYLLAEFIWYLSGDSSPESISPYSKMWVNLTNSGDFDGYKKGTVNSNYGTRLFGLSHLDAFTDTIHPIDQWAETIELLTHDKDTRQAVMNIHVPSDRHVGNKDIVCTLTLQWFIRENALHLIVNMRSNDVIFGFTNDVFQFTILQECMLMELRKFYPDIQLGHYFHNAGSMHIYERHFDMAISIFDNEAFEEEVYMPPMDAWDNDIAYALVGLKRGWELSGMSKEYKFDETHWWKLLTPYWRNLVLLCFFDRKDILHSWSNQ